MPATQTHGDTSGAILSAIGEAALRPRPVWRSERAYILSAIAGVIGLGNIWRFPYMAGLHGGGSFVLAYVICVVVIAVPLAILESGAGNLTRRSPVGLFRGVAGRYGAGIGWAIVGLTVAIMSYYFVITGWTLGYTFDAVLDRLTTFSEFTSGMASLWLFLLVGGLVFVFLLREVSMIERASLFLMPLLFLIVIFMAIYAQTLERASEARSFYLGIDMEALTRGPTWRAAAGQAFYSLGVGQGVLIAYGSYVPAGANILRSTAAIAATNSGVSILAGLMVFPIVFTFGIAPDTGSQLSFTAFPRVFEEIAGGAYLAIAFFTLLFVAGFTSCLGGAMVAMSVVRDEFRLPRATAARWVVGLIVVLGVPSALSFTRVGLQLGGVPFLDRIDQATGSGVLVFLGLLGAAILAIRLPRRRLIASFNAGRLRPGPWTPRASWIVTWSAVVPMLAVVLLILATLVSW